MEPDSTTQESKSGLRFPFKVQTSNLRTYLQLTKSDGEGSAEMQLVENMQSYGLLPETVHCVKENCKCQMICKPARVVDKVQWVCESCESRLPIRLGSFFNRMQCSLLQAMQVFLAWAEDAEWEAVAQHFEIKERVVYQIFEKLDVLACQQHSQTRLGGEGAVVLAEMYPDCLNRLSPDTTDLPPLGHKILMLADTKHIPTRYCLHVLKQDPKKAENTNATSKSLKKEVSNVISAVTVPGSQIVTGNYVPSVPGATSLPSLLLHCQTEMRHFLCERIWRQALILCSASRSAPSSGDISVPVTAASAQRYLNTALFRLAHPQHLLHTILTLIADTQTLKSEWRTKEE